jgi:hypothetical protein
MQIDRNELVAYLEPVLKQWGLAAPNRSAVIGGVLALAKPGYVVLSAEESAMALQWFDELNGPTVWVSSRDQALAGRLAAAAEREDLTQESR